ncbi:MAG TPA: hypothetical protein H9701_09235 [Candidatus Intestinimonas pullistercoris]|uniref:Transglutaminase-like domain-containing protein n=1 Tax=Candidatus Intestinimonas pullistercoris TaxID=2838623 RepID=A0A9D2T199_9FIRM|nr:hypothetical protein [Candidatus Intestinimonas pullistercoris]
MNWKVFAATGVLALGLILPTAAAVPEAESLPAETVPLVESKIPAEETGLPQQPEVVTAYGEAELFQAGSFIGPYTIPGEVQLMDSTEQELYDLILEGLDRMEAKIDISEAKIAVTASGGYIDSTCAGYQTFKTTYEKVVNDHPELYYVRGLSGASATSSGSSLYLTTVTPLYDTSYAYDRNTFNEKVDEIVAMAEGMTELEAVLFFHDHLVTTTAYSRPIPASPNPCYNAYGALVNGEAVCQGYALAYKLLLNRAGIECITVSSSILNHMWNAVQLSGDSNWYYVDVTWDDPTGDKLGQCRHNNFLLSETGLRGTNHTSNDWTFNPSNDASIKYESGWAFNGVDTALYRWEGGYYYIENQYINTNTISGAARLYYSPLKLTSTNQKLITTIDGGNFYTTEGVFSAIWLEGKAYCLGNFHGNIACIDLDTGVANVMEAVSNSQSSGLLHNAVNNTIEVWSDMDNNGDRELLSSFEIKSYPPEWDNTNKDTTAIVGTAWDGGTLQIGLVWAGDFDDAPLLLAAFYQKNGKLLAVRDITITDDLSRGLHVLTLESSEIPDGYTRASLFLLDGDGALKPLVQQTAISEAA